MTRPDGTVEVVGATTDATGRFTASFSLIRRTTTNGRKSAVEPGTYAFQAHVMGAARIAPADSNIVFLDVAAKGQEDKPTLRPHKEIALAKTPRIVRQKATARSSKENSS